MNKLLDFSFFDISVNNQCNFDCLYCRTKLQPTDSQEREITLKTLEDFYQILLSDRSHPHNISFGEKEPLLSWHILEPFFLNIGDITKKKIYQNIVTNGSLITPQIAKVVQDNKINLLVSLDGNKQSHEMFRGNTFDTIISNLQYIEERDRLNFSYVVNPQTLPFLYDSLCFLNTIRSGTVDILLNFIENWTPQDKEFLQQTLIRFLSENDGSKFFFSKGDNVVRNIVAVGYDRSLKILPPVASCLPPSDENFLKDYLSLCNIGNLDSLNESNIDKFINLFGKNYSKLEFVNEITENVNDVYQYKMSEPEQFYFKYRKEVREKVSDIKINYDEIMSNANCVGGCINLTDDCNMACKYCFVCDNPRKIDLGTAKQAVMFFASHYKGDSQKIHLNFFGGEPMMEFNSIIVPLVEWTEETGIRAKYNLSFGMTTNATLHTPETLKWCYDHNITMLLSIDGGPEVQDYQRPMKGGQGSFETLFNIIPTFLHYYPDVTYRSTLYPDTVDKVYEGYLWAKQLGFKSYFSMPDEFSEWSPEQIMKLKEQYSKIYWDFYFSIARGEPVTYIHQIMIEMQFLVNPFPRSEIIDYNRCGLGTVSYGVGVDGSLWGCQEHASYLDKKDTDIFFIGDIFTGVDRQKHAHLLTQYAKAWFPKMERCATCYDREYCTARRTCPSHNYLISNTLAVGSKIGCEWRTFNKQMADLILQYAGEHNDEVFQKYLLNNIEKGGRL